MKLGDSRRMKYCRTSFWQCDFPECGCALTHEDPPEEKKTAEKNFYCPSCGNVILKSYNNTDGEFYWKNECSRCKSKFEIIKDHRQNLTVRLL